MKRHREFISMAVRLGLEPLPADQNKRHIVLRFKNKSGLVMRQTVSLSGTCPERQVTDFQSQIRRFARGETHGLRVERG